MDPRIVEKNHIDLNYILGKPLKPKSKSKTVSLFHLLQNQASSPPNDKEFYHLLRKRIDEINSLMEITYADDPIFILRKLAFKNLPLKINTFLTDFLKGQTDHPLYLEDAQKIYGLAQDLKRHESDRCILWKKLSKPNQEFLHRLSYWTEDLKVLKENIPYQWIGIDVREWAEGEEFVLDLGEGRLFKVFTPCEKQNFLEFPLSEHPGFKLFRPLSDRKEIAKDCLMKHVLEEERIGRISEVFNVNSLVNSDEEHSILYHNRFLLAFSCYRSGLCSVLEIPVFLPLSMGRQGEWSISLGKPKSKLRDRSSLSPQQLNSLRKFFHIEKLYHVDIFKPDALAVCDENVFMGEIYPLPTFLQEKIEDRHKRFKTHLHLDDLSNQSDELEKSFKDEQQKMDNLSKGLQILMKNKGLTLEDLLSFDDQTLLIVRLLGLLDQSTLEHYPITLERLFETAVQMLSSLMADKDAIQIPYSFNQTTQNLAKQYTESTCEAKKLLKKEMLLFILDRIQRKTSSHEFVNNILELGQLLYSNLLAHILNKDCELAKKWLEEVSLKDSFMELFFNEFSEELKKTLTTPIEYQENFQARLFLLREAIECPGANISNINKQLQSLLHDAMQKKYSDAFLTDMKRILNSL